MLHHEPVLVREAVDMLNIREEGTYLDATAGGGGHSREILARLSGGGKLVCTDRDAVAIRMLREQFDDQRVVIRQARFSEMEDEIRALGIRSLDGILLDLGVSMFQLRDDRRGFSFDSDAPLDMRMDATGTLTAERVVNEYPEKDLAEILWKYADERKSRKIARAIADERRKKRITECRALAAIVARVYGRRGRIHPATRTFQALRIEVNRELEELRAALDQSPGLLKQGGRLCVISYHSLEDRMVKHFIRDKTREGVLTPLIKKAMTASADERRRNPSSRSAKLRGAEKR